MKRLGTFRFVTPLVLAAIIGVSLWFASPRPARALDIQFNAPASGTLGQVYTFSVRVEVADIDVLPVQSADLVIYNVSAPTTYTSAFSGLPLTAATDTRSNITVSATAGPGWGAGYSDNRVAYWGGYGYRLDHGYGYGSASGNGGTWIDYAITWTAPSSWPSGNYQARVTVHGDNGHTFSRTSTSFTLVQPPAGGGFGGGGGGGAPPSGPGVTNLSLYTNSDGVFLMPATASSEDGRVRVSIEKGVTARTRSGTPLKEISINRGSDSPVAPENTMVVGFVYDLKPDGASFDPAAVLIMSYDGVKLPAGLNENRLLVCRWDESAGQWRELQTTADLAAHTVSAKIDRLGSFAILAHTKPASFAITNIVIAPEQPKTGDRITVTATVTNDGDLSGSCPVTLNINGKKESSQTIAVDGNSMQTVTFSFVRSEPGVCNIEVNGVSSTVPVSSSVVLPQFRVNSVAVFPSEVDYGNETILSAIVQNTGSATGDYTVAFKIDGEVVSLQQIRLDPQSSRTVEFSISTCGPGVHEVDVNGVKASFTVKPVAQPAQTRGINWWVIALTIFAGSAIAAFVSVRLSSRSRRIPPVPPRAPPRS